jgi:hypothetical protein
MDIISEILLYCVDATFCIVSLDKQIFLSNIATIMQWYVLYYFILKGGKSQDGAVYLLEFF